MPDPTWRNDEFGVSLYLGDCLDVLPTLEPRSVDAVVTDPPYGHNNNNGDLIHRREEAIGKGAAGESRAIHNDGSEANEIFKSALPEWYRLLKPGCCCCCGGGGGPDPQFARWSMWMNEVFEFKQMVVWDKGPIGMGWHYRRSYETVLVGMKPGAACRWTDTTQTVENIIRPGAYGIRKIIPNADQHPTQKPVELAELFIRLHTFSGDTVLDSFAGSGTTGVACRGLGRKFVGVESDPYWFDIAVRRIEAAILDRKNDMFGGQEIEQGEMF